MGTPADMERYFTAGQPVYRGDTRALPAGLHTSEQILSHLFPEGQMTAGKSWTTDRNMANNFSRRGRAVAESEPQVNFVLHSSIDPKNISFDKGEIEDDSGKMQNWSRGTDWRQRHSGGPKGKGFLNESEVIMKTKSEVPVTGITLRYGSMMNYKQFETPLTARTSFPTPK